MTTMPTLPRLVCAPVCVRRGIPAILIVGLLSFGTTLWAAEGETRCDTASEQGESGAVSALVEKQCLLLDQQRQFIDQIQKRYDQSANTNHDPITEIVMWIVFGIVAVIFGLLWSKARRFEALQETARQATDDKARLQALQSKFDALTGLEGRIKAVNNLEDRVKALEAGARSK